MARLAAILTVTALLGSLPMAATVQAQQQSPQAAAPASSQQLLGADQLDQLVAPIALYPDALLSQVLIASTYPLEVVQADRFASQNKHLSGDQLKAATDTQNWDDSVKSLVATPAVLSMMSTKLDWTENLGDAVLAQQPDVMDAIQRLRAKAQAQNTLKTTPQQTVSVQQDQGKQVIVVAPTQPDTVYVPYYDPSVVYGPWPYPAYPPYYFPPPGYVAGAVIATGIAFGVGYAVGRWASGGGYWGGGFGWGNNNINVNRSININNFNGNGNNWQHNPAHRRGVAYNNPNVQQRFGNNALRSGSQNRMDFRGRSGNQVLQPGAGANRPGAGGGNIGNPGGNRPGAGGGNLGNAGANRPGAGSGRPGNAGVNRPGAGGAARPVTRESGLGNIQSRNIANAQSQRGRASIGGGGGGPRLGGGGGGGGGGAARIGGGGGGARGGGGGGRRR